MNDIDIPNVIIPRTTTIGGSHVLPGLPYEPTMPVFPSVDISTSTLPAHNAAQQIGHSLNAGPRPSPTVVHDTMAGAGGKNLCLTVIFRVMDGGTPNINLGSSREERPSYSRQ